MGYQILETTADGNCMFNAISLIFNGTEDQGCYYRLLTTVHMAERLPELSKYVSFFLKSIVFFQQYLTKLPGYYVFDWPVCQTVIKIL